MAHRICHISRDFQRESKEDSDRKFPVAKQQLHGYNIGLSGFTPAGTPKAVTPEVAKIAEEEHAKGNPFQISIFTGASTGDATDGILSRVKAIRYRAPYTTNPDFRKAVNIDLF